MIQQTAEITASPLPLEGLCVGISGAVPERQHWGNVVDLDRLILTFVAQLSALIIRYGGQVVHGSQPLLTPVIAEQARRQLHGDTECLKLFASQVFGKLPEVTERAARAARAEVLLTAKVGEGDQHDPTTRNQSLTAMRLAMTQDIDVLVAIGGKLHRDTGFNPGVLEELAQARWHSVPCFVIGAFGGSAGRLERQMIEELCSGNLLEEESDAKDLARWTATMDEHVGELLVHLVRHKNEFSRKSLDQFTRSVFTLGVEGVPAKELVNVSGVVHVDPALVKVSSARFGNLMKAMEETRIDQARSLLRSGSF